MSEISGTFIGNCGTFVDEGELGVLFRDWVKLTMLFVCVLEGVMNMVEDLGWWVGKQSTMSE